MFDYEKRKKYFNRIAKKLVRHDFIHGLSSECLQENLSFFSLDKQAVMFQGFFGESINEGYAKKGTVLGEFDKIPDSKFDAILLNLFLTFSSNLGRDLLKYKALLNKEGVLIGSLFGNNSLVELRHVLSQTDFAIFNKHYSRIVPMYHIDTVTKIVKECGFKDVVVSVVEYELFYKSLFQMLLEIKYGGYSGWLKKDTNLSFSLEYIEKAETLYKSLAFSDGKLQVSVDLITITSKV